MAETLLEAAGAAVALATKHGASDAIGSAYRERSVEFAWRDGKLERVSEATSRSIGLRLWVDGRYGDYSSTDLRTDRLDAFVRDAVAMTRALEPDPLRVVPDPALFAGRSTADLELVDPAAAAVSRDERLAWCAEMDARLVGKGGVISATSSVSDSTAAGARASTNGFEGQWERTNTSWSADVTVRDEGDRRPEGSMWGSAVHRADLPERTWVADQALALANARLGATRGPTRKGLMVVEPRAGGKLIGSLLGAASGQAMQQGRSFWNGKIGQPVLSPKLAITDEPLLPRGLASRWYDGDGIAARSLPIVADGKLVQPYVDTYYAAKLGIAPTATGPSNRVVAPGKRGLDAIVADASEAILITSWLGGNFDPTSGDFSFGIRGHLVSGGKVGAPIGEMNVTGNLLELFAGLVEVGNDPWMWSSTRVPTLAFDGVQFSGV